MISRQEAARSIALREANREQSTHAVRRIQKQVRRAIALGRRIVLGKQVEVSTFDEGTNQDGAAERLDQVAEILGVNGDDASALQQALASLIQTVNGVSDATTPTAAAAQFPRVIDKHAVARGRERLGWPQK